jgi:enoyl-CoA hydratase/carnithine racemase
LTAGVHCSIEAGVAWLTLGRPRAGNRIDQATAQGLCSLTEEIEHDDRVAVVALEARGSAFCLGVEDGGAWEETLDWVAAIGRLTRPVICAVNGPAVGEGFELALACDLRIAGARAAFSLPQLAAGRLPRHGATQRLPRLIGHLRALDLLLTGRRLGAREAADMGLVSRIVPPTKLAAALRGEVANLAGKGPVALRFAKEAVLKGLDLTFDQGARLEQDLYALLQTTLDRAEGIQAFRGKRRPRFSGR